MPLEELPAAAEKAGCRAIILSGILLPESEVVEHALPALMKQCKVPVFLGGHASVKVHDSLRRHGVNALGTDLNNGLARLRDIIPED